MYNTRSWVPFHLFLLIQVLQRKAKQRKRKTFESTGQGLGVLFNTGITRSRGFLLSLYIGLPRPEHEGSSTLNPSGYFPQPFHDIVLLDPPSLEIVKSHNTPQLEWYNWTSCGGIDPTTWGRHTATPIRIFTPRALWCLEPWRKLRYSTAVDIGMLLADSGLISSPKFAHPAVICINRWHSVNRPGPSPPFFHSPFLAFIYSGFRPPRSYDNIIS